MFSKLSLIDNPQIFEILVRGVTPLQGLYWEGFKASLYYQEIRMGVIKDDGSGSGIQYSEFKADGMKILDKLFLTSSDKEKFIYRLIDVYYLDQRCKDSTLFVLKGDRRGEARIISRAYSSRLGTFLRSKYSDQLSVIYNEHLDSLADFVVD